jgi:hypothetical protein
MKSGKYWGNIMGLSKHEQKCLRAQRRMNSYGQTAKDYRAKREGEQIDRMHIIGPVQQPRLNKTYQDGSGGMQGLHCTGKKHRKIG